MCVWVSLENFSVFLIHIFLGGFIKTKFCLRKNLKLMTNMGPHCNLQALLNVNL